LSVGAVVKVTVRRARVRMERDLPKAGNPKWKAVQFLREMILKEREVPGDPTDESVTSRRFAKECYNPIRQGKWSPAYRKTNVEPASLVCS
jgi:hypothetical protein